MRGDAIVTVAEHADQIPFSTETIMISNRTSQSGMPEPFYSSIVSIGRFNTNSVSIILNGSPVGTKFWLVDRLIAHRGSGADQSCSRNLIAEPHLGTFLARLDGQWYLHTGDDFSRLR